MNYSGVSQVVINEICPRNATTFMDEENESSDWIELFNPTGDSVNLQNWYISDDISNMDKWQFPELKLPPDSFLIVFASGRNKKNVIDHWETIIHAEDTWKYWIPYSDPDSAWASLNFNDTTWLEGPGGFGRGDGDDNTVLPDSVATVYIRKTFNIADTSVISSALLHMDYDDAFVAFLNGVEIARTNNIGWPGKYQHWYDISYDVHTALMIQGLLPEEYSISPSQLKSIIKEGENVLAVQGFNAWNNHGNSSLIPYLSVSVKDTSHFYSNLPEWFGNKPVYLHTNFKLSSAGESLMLSDTDGNMIDLINYPHMQADNSYGLQTDAGENLVFFFTPTPGYSNDSSTPYTAYTKTPQLSIDAGFYNESLNVGVLNFLPGDTLRYTLNGSTVADSSTVYSGNIFIDSTTVLKTRFFHSNKIPGKTTTNSYIINYTSTLPVISLSINPHDLWDWEEGIYVLGPGAGASFPFLGANFWQDWEKPIHLEYFDPDQNPGFEIDADVVIHGGFSRAYNMKSLRILTNGKYDTPEINYQVFKNKDIQIFKKLILRNSGQDFNKAHFRDAFMHDLVAKNTNIDYQAYEPSVVFLNGEYWGIHNIREKIDRYYVNSNFAVHPDSVELLRDNRIVVEGNYYHYQQMVEYIKSIQVVDSAVYDSISRLVDIDNYSDYFIAEMFYVNHDWPGHNTKYWRKSDDTSIWRYILTDTDFGFGTYSNVTDNELYRVLHNNIMWADNHWILRRLMGNLNYREYFINRSADMFNTVLHPEVMIIKILEYKERLAPEMIFHKERWGGTYEGWEAEVDEMIYFAENRGQYSRQHYINEFNLEKTVEIGLDVDSIIHGSLKINTIFPDSLPWQGIYFDGNPVTITAVPDSGFLFSHWESSFNISENDSLSQMLHINVDTNATFIAYFYPDTFVIVVDTPYVTINEINYHSHDTLDAGDWVELFNPDTMSYDLSAWVFKDGNDDHEFIIPDSMVLDTGQYLVLYRDSLKFPMIFPEVENAIGPFNFGLKNEGEELRLYDSTGMQIYNVPFTNLSPWPDDADGTGKTINLVNPLADPLDGANWFSGCIGGSPGGPTIPCDTVGVYENTGNNFELKLYPNPVSGQLNVLVRSDYSETLNIIIFNIYGNAILKATESVDANIPEQLIFSLDPLPEGVYFIKISSENINFCNKILLQH
ncbi:MAG: CotH kinase family protein [Bacteroidales bacterium]|nr:CotH kinase family protein [Bacteroidales bacterium]